MRKCLFAAAILAVCVLAFAAPPAGPAPWKGPEKDFRVVDGRIVGEWWQGGGLGVVYYTGPNAQKLKPFEDVGRKLAEEMGRPYLEIHADDVRSSDKAVNGILAYPDGTARVRLFLMPGGNGSLTTMELAGVKDVVAERGKFVEARKVPQGAVRTGMNYVATCGGFFTGASGYTIPNTVDTAWNLWPGRITGIGPGMKQPFPDVVFDKKDKDHPLVKAVPGGALKEMFFNGGQLGCEPDVPDTDYLGTYVGGAMDPIKGQCFCIAWRPKDNGQSGRVVMTTGHPEAKHTAFLLAMAEYACAHDYEVPRKFIEPGKPVEGVSGDDQVQYYCVKTKAKQKLAVKLTGLTENCDLYLRFGLPPLFKKYDSRSAKPKTAEESLSVAATRVGEYFIGVHGNHTDRNGAKYTLSVTLEGGESEIRDAP